MAFRWTGGRSARHERGVFAVIALMAGWLTSVPAWAATVQSVAIREGRIVIRFDEAVGDAASRVLTGPRQIAVDVTGLDVALGDPVELFGAHRLLDDAATAAGTISYELLTSVTARVPRRYVQ